MPVHPEFAERFTLLEGVASFPEFSSDPRYAERFRKWDTWEGASPPEVDTEDHTVPGPHGPIPIRVYRPANSEAGRPGLVWIHGGGFMSGDLNMAEADWTAREVAFRAAAVVVSVDYRLAVNGTSHPVPHDDCVAATRWVRDNASDLGIADGAISLGGASAGANLAVGVALRLRDIDGWQPRSLLPIYGIYHPVLPPMSLRLVNLMADLPVAVRIPPDSVPVVSGNYLGGPVSSADGYAMPALADLEGLCPVTVVNAEYDVLAASGEAFTARLALAGNQVRMVTAAGMLHAFLNLPARVEPVDGVLTLMADVVAAAG